MPEPIAPLQQSIAKTPPRRRRRTRRWVKRGLLLAGVLAFAAALVYAWLPKPVVVDVAVARRTSLDVVVETDGRTRVRDRFVVSAPGAGNLARIELDPGDAVAVGDVVALLDPPDPALLDERTRAAAEAQVGSAAARKRQADAAIARAQVARDQARRETARITALFRAGAVPGSERERVELADELAANDLAQAELARSAAAAELANARAALGRGVARGNERMPIRSPAGGKVLRVLRDSAGPVAAGTPLLELGDPGAIEIVVDVLSSDAARIAIGAPVTIEEWGGDRPLVARVRRIEPSAFTEISALGIEEQRVNVIASIESPPPELGDGFRIEARIVTWHGGDVLAIPSSAVFRDRGRWAVYVVEQGRAQLQPVELGHRGRLDVEVLGGLAEGTTVIVHPGDRITDKRRVEPR